MDKELKRAETELYNHFCKVPSFKNLSMDTQGELMGNFLKTARLLQANGEATVAK